MCVQVALVHRPLLWFLIIVLLYGCASDRTVVHGGAFQKRKHRPGWHVDLGRRDDKSTARNVITPRSRSVDQTTRLAIRRPATPVTTSVRTPLSLTFTVPVAHTSAADLTRPQSSSTGRSESELGIAAPAQLDQNGPEDLMPKKRWNQLAIPAFILALFTIYLGLFTLGTTAVIVAAVITIVVAGISLRHIRKREQAGKGFALAALIIGLIAALVTAITIAVVGFI